MAALKQSDRVSSIHLTITESLLEKLPSIEGTFSELEDLVLLSEGSGWLTLPSTFRWGPRLRSLHLTRITFPAPLQLLFSSRNLVDLQLHEVLCPWYFSPEALTNALSVMAQLRSLSFHFLSSANCINVPPLSGKRVVLPALTRLDFRGFDAYLGCLVARIDAPLLGDIEITYFDDPISDVPKLCGFIDRIEMQKSHRQAYILSSERAISISLTQRGTPTRLKLQVFRKLLSEPLLSVAQIYGHFSAFLFGVEDLRVNATRPSRSYQGGRWQELLDSFVGVKWFHVAGNLSTDIMLGLQPSGGWRKTVLPALHKLCIREPEPRYPPLRKAVASVRESRWLSGHFIAVEYERPCIDKLSGTGTTSTRCSTNTTR